MGEDFRRAPHSPFGAGEDGGAIRRQKRGHSRHGGLGEDDHVHFTAEGGEDTEQKFIVTRSISRENSFERAFREAGNDGEVAAEAGGGGAHEFHGGIERGGKRGGDPQPAGLARRKRVYGAFGHGDVDTQDGIIPGFGGKLDGFADGGAGDEDEVRAALAGEIDHTGDAAGSIFGEMAGAYGVFDERIVTHVEGLHAGEVTGGEVSK